MTLSPAHMVPGIEASSDDVFSGNDINVAFAVSFNRYT